LRSGLSIKKSVGISVTGAIGKNLPEQEEEVWDMVRRGNISLQLLFKQRCTLSRLSVSRQLEKKEHHKAGFCANRGNLKLFGFSLPVR
jgi:hypothetical protein